MFKLGICNELFEDMEFSRACRLVKEIGYDGLEIAPFTLAGSITDLTPVRSASSRRWCMTPGSKRSGCTGCSRRRRAST